MQADRQTRRVQLSGGSTYVVSLPKRWVEDMRIRAGDSVTLLRNPNRSVTLYPGREDEVRERTHAGITTCKRDSGESVRRRIIAAYLGGYKTIEIRSRGVRMRPEHIKAVRQLVRTSMIGTEIVESGSESMMIQVLTRLPELSFEAALKRMHLMALNMHREAVESLSDRDLDHADEVIRMDDEVDRFSLYMRRNLTLAVQNAGILLDMGLQRPSDCLGYRSVVGRIERIADHAGMIAKRVKFLDGTIEPRLMRKISGISENALRVFEGSIRALLDRDFDLAERIADEIRGVVEDEKTFMSGIRESGRNSTVIRFVLEDIRRTAEYSSDIVEVAIDENISSVITEK